MDKTVRVRRKKDGTLNKREKAILKAIEKSVVDKGYAPSVREIGKEVCTISKRNRKRSRTKINSNSTWLFGKITKRRLY